LLADISLSEEMLETLKQKMPATGDAELRITFKENNISLVLQTMKKTTCSVQMISSLKTEGIGVLLVV